jgi:flagellar M-ring protein FliF
VEKVNVENLPLWRQPETIELAKTLAWPVGLGVAAAVVLLGLLLRRRKQKKQEATAVDLLAAEELERPHWPRR